MAQVYLDSLDSRGSGLAFSQALSVLSFWY